MTKTKPMSEYATEELESMVRRVRALPPGKNECLAELDRRHDAAIDDQQARKHVLLNQESYYADK